MTPIGAPAHRERPGPIVRHHRARPPKESTIPALSKDAAALVRDLSHRAALPRHGGVRIVVNPVTNSLSMGLADHAERSDVVLGREDALLFLSTEAAVRLDGMELCAEVTSTRSSFFLRAA